MYVLLPRCISHTDLCVRQCVCFITIKLMVATQTAVVYICPTDAVYSYCNSAFIDKLENLSIDRQDPKGEEGI